MVTKILIVGHDTNDIGSIQHELKRIHLNCLTTFAQSENEYKVALHNFKPDLILSNYSLPYFDALTVFKLKQKLTPQSPFIFVTKIIDIDTVIAFIKIGVTDFIQKEKLSTLGSKINRALQETALNKLNVPLNQLEKVKDTPFTKKNEQIPITKPVNFKFPQTTRQNTILPELSGIVDNTAPQVEKFLEEHKPNRWPKEEMATTRKEDTLFSDEHNSPVFKDSSKAKEIISRIVPTSKERKLIKAIFIGDEAFSNSILDLLSSPIIVINATGTILKVNKPWKTFARDNVGINIDKYSDGANYFDAYNSQSDIGDESASKALKGIKDVLNGIVNEFYLEYPYDSLVQEKWFNMTVNKLESSETMVLIEHQDISKRKMAEQKLSTTTNALQKTLNDNNRILDSALDIICSFDEKGRFVQVNAASEFIWGYKSFELIGKSYIDFVYPEDAENTINAFSAMRSGELAIKFKNRFIHKNGIIVSMIWSAIWDNDYKLSNCIAKKITKKKCLEKAFEIEKKRFIDLCLQAPICMGILKGPNYIYEIVNPHYLKLIGKKNIIGKTVKEVLPELEAQGIFDFLDRVYQTGETFSANEMLVKYDHHGAGNLVDTYLNFIYQAHRNGDGTIDGIVLFANDVTEQVISRKKIEESEKRYWELIQNLPVATYSCDDKGRIMIYNKAAAALWGGEPEIEKDIWCGTSNVYNRDGKPLTFDLYPMAIALKERKSLVGQEIIIGRPNGDKRNVLAYSVPFVDIQNKVTGTVNVLADITENKRAQLAIKESEKKYRQIVETAQEGIWMIDEKNKTTFVNRKMCEVLEYTVEEIMENEIFYFMNEKGIDIALELMKKNKADYSCHLNFKFISKTGKEIWTHISTNSIFNSDGIYKGVLAMVTDITERKKAERHLKKQNKELVKINAELDRFVYSVSHDLRSPLTSILGLLSFIEEESRETNTLEYAEMIRSSINRLDEFIKNILSYSRNSRLTTKVEKILIKETITTVVDSFRNIKMAIGIHFEIDIKEQHSFHSDSLRFNTILENLISNAIKHHKKNESGRFIKITGCTDNQKLRLNISDNGIGISPTYHNKIFDMFFRLSGETDGSGIGLYIVKDIVEKLGGNAHVESELGTGSAFIITLKNLKP